MRSIIVGVVAFAAGFSWVQAQPDCSTISSEVDVRDRSSQTLPPTSTLSCDCPDEPAEDPLALSSGTTVRSDDSTSPDITMSSSTMPPSPPSSPTQSTTPSPQPPIPSHPPAGSVRVEFLLDDTRYREDVEVKASSAKPKKVKFMAFSGRVVGNNGLGLVQCNVEINHGQYTYETVPAFTTRFPVSFDRPQNVTGVKCYKI